MTRIERGSAGNRKRLTVSERAKLYRPEAQMVMTGTRRWRTTGGWLVVGGTLAGLAGCHAAPAPPAGGQRGARPVYNATTGATRAARVRPQRRRQGRYVGLHAGHADRAHRNRSQRRRQTGPLGVPAPAPPADGSPTVIERAGGGQRPGSHEGHALGALRPRRADDRAGRHGRDGTAGQVGVLRGRPAGARRIRIWPVAARPPNGSSTAATGAWRRSRPIPTATASSRPPRRARRGRGRMGRHPDECDDHA